MVFIWNSVKTEKSLQKNMGSRTPHAMTRFGRNASDYDLHEMAGGSPLLSLAAPNVRVMSKHEREVCNPERKSNIPNI